MVRWLAAHPELRAAAQSGQPMRFLALLLASWRGPRPEPLPSYRPEVRVAAESLVPDEGAPLFDDVQLRRLPGASGSIRVALADGLVMEGAARGCPVHLLEPIDVRACNPIGLPHRAASDRVELGAIVGAADARTVRRTITLARGHRVVDCSGEIARPPEEVGRWIVQLAASGAVLTGAVPDPVRKVIGDPLADSIQHVDPSLPAAGRDRAVASLNIRRCALSAFTPRGTWQRIGDVCGIDVDTVPRVSVLLPSNRPGDVVAAARQVSAQRGVEVQLVVALHGEHMPRSLDDELAAVFGGELVIRRLPADLNLGQVMNELTAAADAPLVSKWDDDDWYDVDHLADLVLAMEYTAAAIVGKAAEYVYLEALDLTMRRFETGAERWSTTIAGGTLMMERDELASVGWAEVPRRVDRELIDRYERRGQSTYRTHGFGYVLR